MRIDRLDLERYGHFDGTSLDLSDPATRLHIVHGANEAGKSTALSAICDLLFGVPHNSGMGFRHSNNALRIGAELSLPDGRRLALKRRKGRTATLLDGDGTTPLPDNLLAPYLAGLDRAGFERLFGLDHERLRQGGQAMLAAGGDLARTLFQAGSGLSGLDRIVTGLAEDADAIGSPHRKQATKPLWQAADAHADATARMRNEATKAEEWVAAEAEIDQARGQLSTIKAALADAQKTLNRLERLRRVRPLLARLDDLIGLLAAAGDGPDLPADLATRWRDAASELLSAERALVRAEADREQADAALADMGPVPPLLPLAPRIEALYQRQGEIAKARADLPRRGHDRDGALHRLEMAARDIGVDPDPIRLDDLLPRRPLTARIREKVKDHARLTQALADAKRRDEAAAATARTAERQQPARVLDPAALTAADAALTAAQRLGEVELRVARDESAQKEGADRLSRLCARLGRFAQAPDILATLPLPTPEMVERQRQREQALENRRQRLEDDRRAVEEEARRLRRDQADLSQGGTLPTPAAIAQARHTRDALWQGLRPHLDAGTRAPADAANGFTQALQGADRLADQRDQAAARVARYMQAESGLDACKERSEALERDGDALSAQAATLATDWTALWQPCGIDPGDPAEMASFLTQAAAILSAHEQLRQQEAALAALRLEAGQCAGHLSRTLTLCGQEPVAGTPLPSLRAAAMAALASAKQASDLAAKAEQDLARARRLAEEMRSEHERAQTALTDWQESWAADMDAIGLPPHAGPAEAEAALRSWEDIAGELRQIQDLDHRIDALTRDIGRYRDDGAALLAEASSLVSGLPDDEEAAPATLFAALAQVRTLSARHEALVQAQTKAHEGARAARQAKDAAAAALGDLRALHRLGGDDDVQALVEAATRRRDLRAQSATLTAELTAAGDGLDLPALRAEGADADPDALAAQAAETRAAIDQAQNDLTEASARLRDAERALEEMRHRAGIGGAAQDAADSAAKAGLLAGRWLRLRAASLLLTQAVERYRDRNEHPLLRRAGSILAAMAASGGNPVVRLKVDYGAGDQPVLVGVRRDGNDAHVEGMSEGLRDQLFLALRIASVEAHVAQSTPLPFIADDLFITSDEARTRAGLLALAELGSATQVVLFTHHEYVVDAGQEALADRVKIHRLSAS